MTRLSLLALSSFLHLLLLTGTFFIVAGETARADGRFLRGQKWEPFANTGTKADFYVAADGQDSWSGTLPAPNGQKTDGPFATIDRARLAVRELKQTVYQEKLAPIEKRWIGSPHKFGAGRDILVLIRAGTYHLSETLTFTPEDGGQRCETNFPTGAFEYHKLKDYFITYAAYPGETPILSGGIPVGPWTKEAGLWVASVEGIQVEGLVVNGQTQPVARIPNTGYFTALNTASSTETFGYRPGELRAWPNMEENRIVMLLRWHTGFNSIARIDEAERTVHLRQPQKGIRVVPPRYYIDNVRALLDAPGEWFYDRKTNRLSSMAGTAAPDLNAARTIVPVLDRLIAVEGLPGQPIRNLRFYGLQMEAVGRGGQAISFQYAHRCELVGTTVRAVGGIGIHGGKGCYHNRILNNRVMEAAQGGIALVGNAHPDQWFDIIRENVVAHNYVAECGGRSIAATNCLQTIIAHNEVTRNRGRTAIQVGGWRNLEEAIDGGYRVEYNHVHHVQQQADDSGAITTAGLTRDSIVRGNLIHDVHGGFFNDNVAIWFDNMSSGWIAEENIYYNLDQGQMKLCACNLVDNVYRNNYLIEPPANPPEGTIDGTPILKFDDIQALDFHGAVKRSFATGDSIVVTGNIKNTGATGLVDVDLYVDGKRVQTKAFPSTHASERQIRFRVQFSEPGEHRLAIGDSAYLPVTLDGPRRALLYHGLTLSNTILPAGGRLRASAQIENVEQRNQNVPVPLLVDGSAVQTQSVQLGPKQSRLVSFEIKLDQGSHQICIGDTPPATARIYPQRQVRITSADLKQHCSGTAAPSQLEVDAESNRYRIEAAGTDFYHGEDSYAATFLPKVGGNFVATTKIKRFGAKTHEWFRAGLFVRNDMAESFNAGVGSLGSVLMFATPGRVGMNWDEHGDGCMHKAKSRNREPAGDQAVWVRLVRHGDSFTGYYSDNGSDWIEAARTGAIPGLMKAIDVGLAAGGPDQRVYEVQFEDFDLAVEQPARSANAGASE